MHRVTCKCATHQADITDVGVIMVPTHTHHEHVHSGGAGGLHQHTPRPPALHCILIHRVHVHHKTATVTHPRVPLVQTHGPPGTATGHFLDLQSADTSLIIPQNISVPDYQAALHHQAPAVCFQQDSTGSVRLSSFSSKGPPNWSRNSQT